MHNPKDCFKYQPEIKKLTKANSIMVDERVIYIVKKDHTGKTATMYFAYDYTTRIQLVHKKNKDALIEYLKDKKLEVLND